MSKTFKYVSSVRRIQKSSPLCVPKVIKYENLVGFRFIWPFSLMFQACGIHVETLEDEESFMNRLRRYFGNFMMSILVLQGWSTATAVLESARRGDYKDITNALAFMSITLSASSKFHIVRTQWRVLHALGTWLKEVQTRGREASRIEAISLLVNKAFFGTSVIITVAWSIGPFILRSKFKPMIPAKYPFLDGETSDRIIQFLQVPVFTFQAVVVSYVGTTLLTLIAVFLTEVRELSSEFTQVTFSQACPSMYQQRLKVCVDKHTGLLRVMEDINIIHNTFFGYQAIIFVAHIVSFIYALLETSSSRTVLSLLPLTSMSVIDFALLCWVGEEISHSLNCFHTSIYMTNWYEARLEDIKSMAIAQEMLIKRRAFTGAKVITASLSTFVEAARQSFSFYTMMKFMTKT